MYYHFSKSEFYTNIFFMSKSNKKNTFNRIPGQLLRMREPAR
jgi:hypothetical protein